MRYLLTILTLFSLFTLAYSSPNRSVSISINSNLIGLCRDSVQIDISIYDISSNMTLDSVKIQVLDIDSTEICIMTTDSLGECRINLLFNPYVAIIRHEAYNLQDRYIYLESPSSWDNYIDELKNRRTDGSTSRSAPYLFLTEADQENTYITSRKSHINELKNSINIYQLNIEKLQQKLKK